ncbi:hypothetical protein V6N13_124213 [Hibiscus sabdariffa]
MRDKMKYTLQKILRKIEDDGVYHVNEISRLVSCNIENMSPQRDNIGSLYATDNDPPSTKFKTPEGGAKSIDANSVCLAPKKAKVKT